MKKEISILTVMIYIIVVGAFFCVCSYAEDTQEVAKSQESTPVVKLLLDNDDWTQTDESDGVKHYSKKMGDSSFSAYKGVCTIECPLDLLYSILCDVSAHTKWIQYCDSSIEVERPTPNHSIQYYTFDIPWPMCDRDIVVNCDVDADWDAGRIMIKSIAIKDPREPVPVQSKLARVTNSEQIWVLDFVSSSQTKVTFYSYATMDGIVPKMLNNLISSVIPSHSLTNLKQMSSGMLHSSSLKILADVN